MSLGLSDALTFALSGSPRASKIMMALDQMFPASKCCASRCLQLLLPPPATAPTRRAQVFGGRRDALPCAQLRLGIFQHMLWGLLTALCFSGCGETQGVMGPGPTLVAQSNPCAQVMMLPCTLRCPGRAFPAVFPGFHPN